MLIVGNSIVSDDIKDKHFCCNIEKCKGMCCVEGDYGAPLNNEEKNIIDKLLPDILPLLPEKSQKVIKKHGFFTFDDEHNLVTQIVDGKDCVFAVKNNEGFALCIFQSLYLKGKTDFIKPISCHLYPIRISQYDQLSALNFHDWDICQSARLEGKQKNVHVYENCKAALIRRFGEKWYDELLNAIDEQK